jgi:outer membrane protein assembly factor BamA
VKFDAREVCGHTLKSSLIHKLSFDTRDDRVMPTTGIQASLVQELAGLSPIGTTAFFKSMCSIDISKR